MEAETPSAETAEKKTFRTSKPGERRGGRAKGTPNKITTDLRTAISDAFHAVGGVEWLIMLAKKRPDSFAVLLGKALPMRMDDEHPHRIVIEWARNDAP
jgi:hypothetical protein